MKIHQKNLQIFATEICKVKNDLGPKIMADIFHFVENHTIRNNSIIQGKKTAQFILEQKVYLLLLQNYGN